MPETESWTVGRLLKWTETFLGQHGSDFPRLEAEMLLAHARQCERIQLYTAYADEVAEEPRGRFRELVKRRAAGEPVAYLVGRREFFSLNFLVTADVLIPRPETEDLIVATLDRIALGSGSGGTRRGPGPRAEQPAGPQVCPPTCRIADVGTGSGAIAVTLAKHARSAHIVALDICPAALAVARENIQLHAVGERVALLESDLLAALPAERLLDVVVSNPPYVTEAELAGLDKSVRDFEPRRALLAGPRGTELIERLIPEAAQRLRPGGWLLLECSPTTCAATVDLIAANRQFGPAEILLDSMKRKRIVVAKKL